MVKYVYTLGGSNEEIKTAEDFHTYFVGEYGVLVHNSYNPKVDEAVQKVPKKYKENGKCDKFAKCLSDLLNKKGVDNEVKTVRTNLKYIFSDILGDSIGNNGFHQGVLVDDIIYDNISPTGIPFNEWLKSLGCDGVYVWLE